MTGRLGELRERWRDPLLTALTGLLLLLLFVLAPLRAENVPGVQELGFFSVAIVTGALLFLSGKPVATMAMLVAIGLAAVAAYFRRQHPSDLDVFLDATAWLLIGLALILEVGRAVFAPGRVTYHRVMGAILLYLAVGLVFVSLFTFIGLRVPNAFSGLAVKDTSSLLTTMIYYTFGALTGAGAGDISADHALARSLSNLASMVGQLYPATLLARLVTLEIEDSGRA